MREQKLPGKPRPRTEVLSDYQAQRGRVRPEVRVLRDLLIPPPEEMFRWRVQLDCGCIHERLSCRDQIHPAEWQENDAVTQRRLPKSLLVNGFMPLVDLPAAAAAAAWCVLRPSAGGAVRHCAGGPTAEP